MASYSVTALYQDAEISYGEGDSHEWAVQGCIEAIPAIYPLDEVMLECRCDAMPLVVSMPLTLVLESM